MNTPTTEQQAVLDSKARVRVVQAVPGSGKTWLVAELIKRELEHVIVGHGGIAALSFTKVGGEEIRKAVGHDLGHPHFVGTLDAFLFRFIVRPFLTQVFPTFASPRLIPAEWEPNKWGKGADNTNFTVRIGRGNFNLFNVCFLGEDRGNPVIACKQGDWGPIAPLDATASNSLLNAKKEIWKKYGLMTHSDAAFLASKILGNETYGLTIRTEVLQRFKHVVVDELQDTGWFLGQCVLQLLAEPSAKGILVGDPDQAIYEFNGARPDLFDRFTKLENAEQLSLGRTRRCGPAVCKVAEYLAAPNRCIDPVPDRTVLASLLSYNNLETDIRNLRIWLANRADSGAVKIIARSTKTVRMIAGIAIKDAPKLGSVPLNHLHRAVNNFRQKRQVAALAAIKAALEYAVFGCEGMTQDEIAEKGIDPGIWKRICVEVLIEASLEINGESFEAWGKRVADFVQDRITNVVPANKDSSTTKKIKMPTGDAKAKIRQEYLITIAPTLSDGGNLAMQTVHAVKGETHDLTVLVCPDSRENRCPSVIWWSDAASDQEERRIAFVAVTRTRGDLILCVSEQSLARLQKSRTDFFQLFEHMSISEFITKYSDHDKAETQGSFAH